MEVDNSGFVRRGAQGGFFTLNVIAPTTNNNMALFGAAQFAGIQFGGIQI